MVRTFDEAKRGAKMHPLLVQTKNGKDRFQLFDLAQFAKDLSEVYPNK